MKKRIIALLLSVLLTLSVIPAVAAAEAQPDDQAAVVEETPAAEPTEAAAEPAEDPAPAAVNARSAELAVTADQKYPAITEIVPSQNGVLIKWSAYAGAAKYIIFTEKTDGTWNRIGVTAKTYFEHQFTPNGKTITYTVRAADKNGKAISAYDKNGTDFACLPTPKLKSLSNAYKGQKFVWDAVSGATGYRVYLKDGKSWIALADVTEPSYIYEGAVSGTSYTFSVRCREQGTNAARSYFDHTGITAVFYDAPKLNDFVPLNGGISVRWKASKGATRYAVLAKSDGDWKRLGYTTDTFFDHTGLTDDTVYTYAVRCTDSKGRYVSSYQSKNNTCRYIAPPVFSSITAKNGKPVLKWQADERLSSYKLDRKEFGGKWTTIAASYDGTSYTDTSVKAGVLYTYTITGLDADGKRITRYIDTNTYYRNGVPASGTFKINGASIPFKDGKPCQGYVTIGKKTYWYGADGKIKKNALVGTKATGYTYADKNGVCCTSEEIKLAAEFMVKYSTGSTLQEKAKNGFMVLARRFPYRRSYDHPKKASDVAPLAIDMFKKQSGNCFRYAACFTCLAKLAGYRTRMVIGYTGSSPHGWNETYVGGRWLISDPDAQLPNYGTRAWGAYMMRYHFWPLSPRLRVELTIDENGKAIWK